jgi:hypothetical protein
MKQVVAILGLAALGAGAWFVASRLSSDALGMIVGLLFGILAGVPAALLVLVANRRRQAEEDAGPRGRGGYGGYPALPQPPVIVVTGGAPQQLGVNGRYAGGYSGSGAGYEVIDYPGAQAQAALPGPAQGGGRPFRLVGEQDGWLEE